MGLIDDLKRAQEKACGTTSLDAICEARLALGVEISACTYGSDLANVFNRIIDRIEQEYVKVPLDADGNPMEISGRYFGKDGRAWMILGFKPCTYDVIGECDGHINTHLKGSWLSTEQPDTQERIDEDKMKDAYDYWGCLANPCEECPAVVDGRKPRERYGMSNTTFGCAVAQGYDLALRQAKLDGRA